jgi:hypothetical protein
MNVSTCFLYSSSSSSKVGSSGAMYNLFEETYFSRNW